MAQSSLENTKPLASNSTPIPGERSGSLFSGLAGAAVMTLEVERSRHKVNGEKYMILTYQLIALIELFEFMMAMDFFGNL